MKKLLILIFIFLFFSIPISVYAQPEKCPDVSDLEDVTVEGRAEFLKALETLIPLTYEKGELAEFYSDWKVITALPFPKTVGREKDEGYYGMAKNFCGKEVADKSWLARIYFPKWEGISASSLEGQIFVAKSKEKGWYVWFRYH
ncbi:hypothetical protein AWH56_018350 [Anaerobacillus isosaccharinicus]|uniref:Uncharacterized protein n=1 Tax=Anaerobacillus isosaccharinicus TaxID=1532552 RepID=A0A1S2M6H5_9BACI|nr:hypothetical protein [Anaerobacillus isosaccharinicus]MBA5587134.1 hypothetical protein [Anaerobacillus isosaccharinicus]QOY34670.1 hypothetical protein AWH56_018350 [Anaerobacillus isosaccharinicus]